MRGFLQAEHAELDALNHILAGTDLHHDKQKGVQQSAGPDIACTLIGVARNDGANFQRNQHRPDNRADGVGIRRCQHARGEQGAVFLKQSWS